MNGAPVLIFIVTTLFKLYMVTFLLRIVMQWIRADYRNPLTQFILNVTNPLVLPLRRVVPPIGKLDTSSLIVTLVLGLVCTIVAGSLERCLGQVAWFQLLWLTVLWIVDLVLTIYLVVLLIYVILSWISPGTYNPMTNLLSSICEPVLRPLRRVIPPIGGLDLSALVALIGIQALKMVFSIAPFAFGLGCEQLARFL